MSLVHASLPPELKRYFQPEAMDPFYNEHVLTGLYGTNWYSVLISTERYAFLHTFSKKRIEGMNMFDVEPSLGYAGPLVNTNDADFTRTALERYSELCRTENVIAELVRFNPLLENHRFFADAAAIDISPAKEIVIARCHADEAPQLAEFSDACVRRVRRGARDCRYRELDHPDEIHAFAALYRESLERLGAAANWYLEDGFFQRAAALPPFRFHGVFAGSDLVSACLTAESGSTAYYLLAANCHPHAPGANEFLIHSIAHAGSRRRLQNLVLGGGTTAASDDPLLRFKRKFSKATHTLFIGKIVHDKGAFDALSSRQSPRPDLFLSYRTAAAP